MGVSQNHAVQFFQLINARYERVSTVWTSNKGFEEWGSSILLVDFVRCKDSLWTIELQQVRSPPTRG